LSFACRLWISLAVVSERIQNYARNRAQEARRREQNARQRARDNEERGNLDEARLHRDSAELQADAASRAETLLELDQELEDDQLRG
jgi:hypothetical protein